MEVAERLAPWASDDNLMLNDDMDRPRWMPEPVPSADAQDTDPNIDVAEMAITEMSGVSETSHSAINSQDTDRIPGSKPPVPTSITEQFHRAGHLPQDTPMVSMTVFVLGALVAFALGILIGFLSGYLMGQ